MSTNPIHHAIRSGQLNASELEQWVRAGGNINEKDSNGITPLCLSAAEGSIMAMEILLNDGKANPDEPSKYNCSALWFATRLENSDTAYRLIDTLLQANARADICSDPEMLKTTPLMNAVRNGLGMKVLSRLLDGGATPNYPENKHSALVDAKFVDCGQYIEALKNSTNTFKFTPELSRFFMIKAFGSLMNHIVQVVNRFTRGVLTSKLGLSGLRQAAAQGSLMGKIPTPESKVLTATEFDSKEFLDDVNKYLDSTGLDKFFPPSNPFLKNVIQKANNLAKKGNRALAYPENLRGLTHLSLYQVIILCDNSTSMNDGDRIASMINVVRRTTDIATTLIPDDDGVVIRFLNAGETEERLYQKYEKVRNSDVAEEVLRQAEYRGTTKLGTVLENDILIPYINSPIDAGKGLERPFLISIITDGAPNCEDHDQLDKEIIKCKDFLRENGFDEKVVNFQISQIGDDPDADQFLERLQTNADIKDLIYCTSGRLDEKFKDLADKDDELDIWLLQTLTGPIMRS